MLTVSFFYELKGDNSDQLKENTLFTAVGVFIEKDIESKTDCNVSDYHLFISFMDNSNKAMINASICFDCPDDKQLTFNVTREQLKLEFIDIINAESGDILIVTTVEEIGVTIANENGIEKDTTTTITPTNTVKTDDTKPSFLDNDVIKLILMIVIGVLAMCICCIYLMYCIRRQTEKNSQKHAQKGMELARIVSVSDQRMNDTSTNNNGHNIDSAVGGTGSRETGSRGTGSRGTGSHDAEPMDTAGADDDIGFPGNTEDAIYGDSAALRMWLNNIGMVQYYDIFIEHGFGEAISALQTINDGDLTMMGITKLAHRKIILMQVAHNGILVQNGNRINIGTDDIDYGEDLRLPEERNDEDEDDTMYRRSVPFNIHNDNMSIATSNGMTAIDKNTIGLMNTGSLYNSQSYDEENDNLYNNYGDKETQGDV